MPPNSRGKIIEKQLYPNVFSRFPTFQNFMTTLNYSLSIHVIKLLSETQVI